MAQTIGEYLYRIAWSLDKSGAAALKKEGDAAQQSVNGLGRSLDKTEQEAKDLTAAADKTAQGMRDVGQTSREAGQQVEKLDVIAQNVTGTLKRLVTGIASITAIRRTFSAILSTATQMDALANSAAAVGASAAGMARLAYATDLAGVNAAEMDTALKGVRQSAAQAAAGIGAGVKAWRLIGVSTRDENGNLKDTTRLIDELGTKFAQMDEGRAQALGKLVKMTPAVITALRTGMMDYAREFDQVLGAMTPTFDEAVKAAQRLHAAQSRLTRIMGLLWQGIATRFFEPFAKAFDRLRQTIVENQAALIAFATTVLQPLAYGLTAIVEVISMASNVLSMLVDGFNSLSPQLQGLLKFAAAYLVYLKAITMAQIGAALTNPFVLTAAAIGAVLILLDDLSVALKGGKTRWDWTPVIKFLRGLETFGDDIIKWIKSLPDRITEALTSIWSTLTSWWTKVINWMTEKWNAFIQTVTGWMPDSFKQQLGIKVEGAPEFKPETVTQTVQQVLDSDPEKQALVKKLGGSPAAPAPVPPVGGTTAAATPARFVAALTGSTAPSVTLGQPAAAAALPNATNMSRVMQAVTAATQAGQTLDRAPALGSNVTNNVDASRKYDVNVPVSNNTTINITATTAEPAAIGDQVERAVDTSNAQMIRNMQTPLAAIADESGNTMGLD